MKEHIIDMLDFYGLAEIVGKENNPFIVKIFQEIGFKWVQDDETAWCSAIANWFCMKYGYARSHKLDARSWLNVGTIIEEEDLEIGDIVIFSRGDPKGWQGHVGFYINKPNKLDLNVLGGNQSNKFIISPYPKSRLLGCRRLPVAA